MDRAIQQGKKYEKIGEEKEYEKAPTHRICIKKNIHWNVLLCLTIRILTKIYELIFSKLEYIC